MKHRPSHVLTDGARPLPRRLLAKLRTRQALVAAAKALFIEKGYEQATVRHIAAAAGMSTGAVFANFTDKADLFVEVLSVDQETLNGAMRAAVTGDTAAEKLASIYGRAYEFHLGQLQLFKAAQAFSWSEPSRPALEHPDIAPVLAREILATAVEAGELRNELDIELAARLIDQAYVGNYGLALRETQSAAALTSLLKRQIALVLASARVGG